MWWRLQASVHSSWSIALACGCFVCGVAAALIVSISGWVGLILFPLLVILFFFRQAYVLVFVAASALLIGISYGSAHRVAREQYASYIGLSAIVSGRIKEDISKSDSGSYSMQLDSVKIDGRSLPGALLVTSRTVNGALRGDFVTVEGRVKGGFGSFPATVSVTKMLKVEREAVGDVGRKVRDGFADKVRSVVPDPQASLGIGFLTGQKSALPSDLSDALKIAGLTHIVVASGYNLTILVSMARKVFLRLSKFLSALSASIMILAFMMVTGLSPSMTRAGLVSGMSLLSWYYGRAFHPFVLLPVAAAITVLFQPSYVWGDLGWQLSFSAFIGVMVVGPLMQVYLFGNKEPSTFRQILGETVAAHLVTVPIIVLSFGTISNVAIIANILVVPLVPLAMLLTFLCGMAAIVSLPFIEFLATPTTWLLGYMTNVATFVSEIPWAQSEVTAIPFIWIGYVAALALACFWMWRKTKYSFRKGEVLMG